MTHIEALVYCLTGKFIDNGDGEECSRVAYDCNGDPHWVAIDDDKISLCSGTYGPFRKDVEPYTTEKEIK